MRSEAFQYLIQGFFEVSLFERIKLFIVLLIAAFIEEFFFRYLPVTYLPKIINFLISVPLFGFAHLVTFENNKLFLIERDWLIDFMIYSLGGLALWLTYNKFFKTKKLIKNTFIHFLSNSTSISLYVIYFAFTNLH